MSHNPLSWRTVSLVLCFTILLALSIPFDLVTSAPAAQDTINIAVLSPVTGSRLSGVVQILGATQHPQFAFYQLSFGPEPNPGNVWFPITDVIQNPVRNGLLGQWNTTLVQDGVYQLRLQVTLRDGTQLITGVNNLRIQNLPPTAIPTPTPVVQPPSAAFTANPNSGQPPLAVYFYNYSSGKITGFVWDFGDGVTSSAQYNPVYTYGAPGTYTATLTVSGPGGASSASQQIVVQGPAPNPPVAAFQAESASGIAPFTTRFVNQSSGNITSYLWGFGDGIYSNEANPEHTYQQPGLYGVTLVVAGPGGSSSAQSVIQVNAPLPPTPVPAPVPIEALPRPGIVFESNRDGNYEVYIMNPDGTNPIRLTAHPADDHRPDVSPNGAHIVFSSTRDDPSGDLYIMDANGANVRRLTTNPGVEDSHPDWSPDGTRIAFSSGIDIYTINADGSHLQLLIQGGRHPDWSPDGTHIAYWTTRAGNSDIYVANADGAHPVRLTTRAATDRMPVWSPDGTRIAYISGTSPNDFDLWVMNADGSHPVRLTQHSSNQGDPNWSPDGHWIAFDMERDIYVIGADGSNMVRITDGGRANDIAPDWR